MDFTHFRASENPQKNEVIAFSDHENMEDGKILNNFIDDSEQPKEDELNFYRKFDPEDRSQYSKFPNQTTDPRVAVYEDDEMFFGTEDQQPELYAP